MGDGRAQEGVDAGKDRGATEGRMARRPAHADKPRVPLPVDLRETAEGAGPQAVPASRQAAPHAFEGQEGEGAAHSDARADHGPAEEGGLATRSIPVTTTSRSNGRSCGFTRTASRRARSRTSMTSRIPRCTVGSRASATAAPPGPRTTARPGGTSRSGRGGATSSWRWRWTFQNKRRRYSHEGRRDTGQRLPLSDIGAVQDTGRSPLHLLLDDRTSRSRAGGPDRRRRARGPVRQP